MLGDRICQTQCNNRACAYDSIVSTANGGVQYDCTPDQISTPCLVAEAQSADSLRESPGASTSTLVPVAFQLAMSPGTRLRALSPPFPQLRSAQPVSHISHTWQAAFRSTATSTRWSVAPHPPLSVPSRHGHATMRHCLTPVALDVGSLCACGMWRVACCRCGIKSSITSCSGPTTGCGRPTAPGRSHHASRPSGQGCSQTRPSPSHRIAPHLASHLHHHPFC
jgi:hypothetical protein